tara:strand:- start:402 stop:554 length:153 start_codon:yes stop_codon:yes gene_type:complete
MIFLIMDSYWFLKNALPLMFIAVFVLAWSVCYYFSHNNYENSLKRKRNKK